MRRAAESPELYHKRWDHRGSNGAGLWPGWRNNVHLDYRNASQMIHCGDEISLDAMHRGDLVFFGTPAKEGKPQRVTHVGIYIGNGRIIHSSHLVRINSIIPGEADYYENAHRLIAARRL